MDNSRTIGTSMDKGPKGIRMLWRSMENGTTDPEYGKRNNGRQSGYIRIIAATSDTRMHELPMENGPSPWVRADAGYGGVKGDFTQ